MSEYFNKVEFDEWNTLKFKEAINFELSDLEQLSLFFIDEMNDSDDIRYDYLEDSATFRVSFFGFVDHHATIGEVKEITYPNNKPYRIRYRVNGISICINKIEDEYFKIYIQFTPLDMVFYENSTLYFYKADQINGLIEFLRHLISTSNLIKSNLIELANSSMDEIIKDAFNSRPYPTTYSNIDGSYTVRVNI